jgi:hypothetical protein
LVCITEFSWVVGGDRQFFVYNVNLTFQNAAENCKKIEAAIVSFSNPSEYILLPRNKPLRGKYWVGGKTDSHSFFDSYFLFSM